MDRVFIISEDKKLYNFIEKVTENGEYLSKLEFINEMSVANIVVRNTCVIVDKENYELDVLRLLAKKMYVILCTNNKELEIDIEDDNRVLIVDKPYCAEQIYCAVKIMLEYREMENELYKNNNKEVEVDARKAAETDYLTGLPNRRGLYEHFDWGIKSDNVHCMFLDIDNFKKVNDTYGHKMGDKLLVKVSHMIKEKIGDAFLARLGGDEFAIMIDGSTKAEEVIEMAENILKATDEIEMSIDISSMISFSIGVMFNQSSRDDLDDILLKCDVAMYQAKKTGKGKYIIYNDVEQQVAYKMSVDRDKYSALALGQFKIYLQPRMNMVTSGIEGVEAEVYWDHPKDGLREPDKFMEIIEEDGFIVDLEMHMFEEVCKIISAWSNTSLETLRVFMRMSKRHLNKRDFVKEITSIAEKFGVHAERFCIGLNEIESSARVQKTIIELKKAGFEISCLKGIGHMGAALLSENDSQADEWVIEKELVKGVCNKRASATMTRSIISLARELNIQIVSKGIEEKKEMDQLTNYGCDIGVGEYFSKPLNQVEFYEFALCNITVKENSFIYDFNGDLKDQNGENEGKFVGGENLYVEDKELGKQVVRFTGVEDFTLQNTLELPANILNTKNYTVSLAIKVKEFKQWASIFYADFSNGFCSIMPYAWDGIVMFRVKDLLYEHEWHDAIGYSIEKDKWLYITATYNSKKHESRLYVNGEVVASRDDVHTIENPVRIVIGGDVYQGTFKGDVSCVVVHDYVISNEEVKKEYEYYIGKGK